jgi:hypothetical protein
MPALQQLFYHLIPSSQESRDRAVGIATGYGLDDGEDGIRVPVRSRIFSTPHRSDRTWGPPRRAADNSPPTSAKVMKMWLYTSTPPHVFMA